MGSCNPIQLTGGDLNRIFRFLCGKGYIRNLKENLRALKREMDDLKAIEAEVKNKVAREEAQHQQRLEAVKVWLTRVESIDTRFNNLLSTSPVELKKLCLCGLSSKSVCSSYKYGKKVFLLLKEVKKLKSEGNFKEVTEPVLRSAVEERPTGPTIGQETMLEKAWKRLMEDGVGIMGLHGMGGVGKTTLFKKIHNKFTEIGRFDVVIWVVVSQGATISKLQDDIAKNLHLCDGEWKNKSESDKAINIHRVLKGKRFVLMLDDIWEKLDLEAIGVPFPTRENGCKVAFTTRSREVCGRMGDHEPMKVDCLGQEEAWKLFKSKVGDNTLSRDPAIVELAKKVAKECCGLPLALVVIGETMSSQTTVQEWELAVDVLSRSAAEFFDMENKILPILKYSYDSLAGEHIKSCFLYCALFPEDYEIDKGDLIKYWMCEGFIGEHQSYKRAVNKGYEVLGTLIRSNLLTEQPDRIGLVVMHDVVREMALWIASESFFVQAGVGLHETPKVKNWRAVRRMSLMRNEVKEIKCSSKCSELTTLLLQKNKLKNLSGEFIGSMQKLVVLDLSLNLAFEKLPKQISKLASLQYLNLWGTSIKQLPVGFQELKKLIHLDLSYTYSLRSISGISKLSSLRILKLRFSKVDGDVSMLEELQPLEHLQVLEITISTELGLKHILGDPRLANCINSLGIRGFKEKPFNMSSLLSMENLSVLHVDGSHVSAIDTYIKCRGSKTDSSHLHNPTSPCFTNLSVVTIYSCHGIKDLTWLLLSPNLTRLRISRSEEVEEIINKEKATNLARITPFQKLEYLFLDNLPELESIYWSPLPFPSLRDIEVDYCPKLRKLPFDATSVPRLDGFGISMVPEEQKTELEWEDEDTKHRFLPLFAR
ncbi:hypothetical protein EUTSA_v10023258mg [Eutrema salsugineum]|uniref:Uncharacterized protein n=1 Tax=Eutrema salsugineum TaxID=72664 RepID=V4KPM4_EUTSA|nr:probable disease resistance protein At1g61180 [Eutrema salsugineum]ESQ29318.1 hypothetical protein EUTSA_v10023258mg [Eutrema salsugineum]